MRVLNLTNPAFGLGQTFSRYLAPLVNSRKRPTVLKVLNALHAESERRAKRIVLRSRPFILHIEPTNDCNLHCPFCVTGSKQNPIPKGRIKLGQYRQVIDEIHRTLVLVRLDGIGESFLHPDIFAMISYATEKRVASAVSTNFTTFGPGDFDHLIDAGLDYLIISFDGSTKATYEGKRVGAHFERVLASIRELVRVKRERRSRTPFIELQFIVLDENERELPAIEALARSLGVDRLLIKEARDEQLQTTRSLESLALGGDPCFWLWYVLNVAWTGDLKDCCTGGLSSQFSFGNIFRNPVMTEWNNDRMRSVRRLFVTRDAQELQALEGCRCLACSKLPRRGHE